MKEVTLKTPAVAIMTARGKSTPAANFGFPDQLSSELESQLKALGLAHSEDYVGLYDNGRLSGQKILALWKAKRQCAEKGAQAPNFPPLEDLIKDIAPRLKEQIAEAKEFKYRDDEAHEAQLKDVPKSIIMLTKEVEGQLHELENGNPQNEKREARKKTIKSKDAETYVSKKLPQHLQRVVTVAMNGETGMGEGIIFHQPHHDLTPGILLLDELFRALVDRIAKLIAGINLEAEKTRKLTLEPLETFVRKLGGDEGGNEFTSYILPGGERPIETEDPIDPTRVELVLDGNHIACASVIVGAWRGGTHSQGHTS